jgi:hypothetical protein
LTLGFLAFHITSIMMRSPGFKSKASLISIGIDT